MKKILLTLATVAAATLTGVVVYRHKTKKSQNNNSGSYFKKVHGITEES